MGGIGTGGIGTGPTPGGADDPEVGPGAAPGPSWSGWGGVTLIMSSPQVRPGRGGNVSRGGAGDQGGDNRPPSVARSPADFAEQRRMVTV
nr:hypothetical protein GCM10020241_31140 [Streptoalloteichus tenebrarius]